MAGLTIASMACGFAALGVALYAHGPAGAAVALFGGLGALAGGLCAALQLAFHGRPAPPTAALPAQALARLVRATLASATSDRPGSAADRRPTLPAAAARPTPAPAQVQVQTPIPADARRFASSAFGA